MSYEITITERREVKKIVGKEWEQIDTKEVSREDEFTRGSQTEPKTRISPVMGYTPEIERTVVETREILKATVDNMDPESVIRAIYGIK